MTTVKIAVLGAGFAGLEAIKTLSRQRHRNNLEITLINQHRWNLFAPLMPDLISGRICPDHMAYELEPFCKRHQIRFEHARVQSIDLDNKTIHTSRGTVQADFLILALGCETNYHGNEVFRKNIPGLKNLHEGMLIRNRVKQVIDFSHKIEKGGKGAADV